VYCSNCGAQVLGSGQFCNRCGSGAAAPPVVVQRKNHPFVTLLAVAFGFFALLIIIGIVSTSSREDAPAASASATAPASASTSKSATADVGAAPRLTKAQQAAQDIAVRKAYAKVLDQQLLDQGIESQTYTVGNDAKTLVIKDVLAGRVRVNALRQNSALFEQVRALGFKHLKYENGLEDELYFGVHWDF
jgi:hypothetical protein